MKRTHLLAVAASMAATAPALADDVRLGSVDVGYRADRDVTWNRFGGGMEGLRLVAGSSDINCRSIVVQFDNGSKQNVFQGKLAEDRPVEVDLAGGTRRVRNIEFVCRSDERRGGTIAIAADVGRFRSEWQRSSDWDSFWSHVFNWAPVQTSDPDYWVPLGREKFEGRSDHESTFGGWGGHSVDRIGLKALDDDARCSSVRATFGNGRTETLDVGPLDQGRLVRVDLPGGDRNLTKLQLVCHAARKSAVTIQISARK